MMNTQPVAALPSQRLLPGRKCATLSFCHYLNASVRALAPLALRGLCRSTPPYDAISATAHQRLMDLGIPAETFYGVCDVGELSRNAEAALTTLTALSSRQRVKTLLLSNPQLLCVPLGVWLDFLTAYGMSRQDFFGLLGTYPELFSEAASSTPAMSWRTSRAWVCVLVMCWLPSSAATPRCCCKTSNVAWSLRWSFCGCIWASTRYGSAGAPAIGERGPRRQGDRMRTTAQRFLGVCLTACVERRTFPFIVRSVTVHCR
ncbi:hypothetical protein Vretimale_9213 [Volvox reticuliferus]|uniref:Uncharacterized protein n=1 Tax=Volvox reticuliferus TaxID=1737510 RepID=A0A8J4LPT2_9CHLO|nr:hypothetical protein Vretimale_9213 [Volvox reticuliferus]